MKICVIGCGWVAMSNHGPALARYAAEHDDIHLAGCCDVNLTQAQIFQAKYGFLRAYDDYQQMLDIEQPQMVALLVPPALICEISCWLMNRGVAVLIEKPPGLALSEAQRIAEVAHITGTPHLVTFNRRFTPLVQQYLQVFTSRFSPKDIQHIDYQMVRIARDDADFSTTAIHGVDAVTYLARSSYTRVNLRYQPVNSVAGIVNTVNNVFLDCILASGATANLSFLPFTGALTERAVIYLQEHIFYLDFPLSKGIDWPGRLLYLNKGECKLNLSGIDAAGGSEDWLLNGFYSENAHFLDALRNGVQPMSGIDTAIQSVAIMEAMRAKQCTWEHDKNGF